MKILGMLKIQSNRKEFITNLLFLSRSRFIYPAMIVIIVATLSFPKGFGMFMAGQVGLFKAQSMV